VERRSYCRPEAPLADLILCGASFTLNKERKLFNLSAHNLTTSFFSSKIKHNFFQNLWSAAMVPMTSNTYKGATVEDMQEETEFAKTDSWSEVRSMALYPAWAMESNSSLLACNN
jgi:hypothetical protein